MEVTLSVETMLQDVVNFVKKERERSGIKENDLKKRPSIELSCISFGEFYNLIYCQLIWTREDSVWWVPLKDPEILKGTHSLIRKIEAKAS